MKLASVAVVVLLAVYVGGMVVFGLCSAMFRNRVVSEIQLDPRYRSDPQWRREADSAMFFMREVKFAIQAGILKEQPRWIRAGRVAACSTFLFFVLLLVLVKLFL